MIHRRRHTLEILWRTCRGYSTFWGKEILVVFFCVWQFSVQVAARFEDTSQMWSTLWSPVLETRSYRICSRSTCFFGVVSFVYIYRKSVAQVMIATDNRSWLLFCGAINCILIFLEPLFFVIGRHLLPIALVLRYLQSH